MTIREIYEKLEAINVPKLVQNTNMYSWQREKVLVAYESLMDELNIASVYNDFGRREKEEG